MNKIKFSHLAMLIFTVVMIVFFETINVNKPRVLVLHSYDVDFSWVPDIDVGINRILARQPYKIRWHYMDTKRHPDKAFKEKAGSSIRKEIDKWKPDVIIAVDDNAQQYAAKYYIDDPHINIVFTGVNKNAEDVYSILSCSLSTSW